MRSGCAVDGAELGPRGARARAAARDPSRTSRSARGRERRSEWAAFAARVRPSIQRGAARRVEEPDPLRPRAEEHARPRIWADLRSRPHLQQRIAERDVYDHLAPEGLGHEDLGRLRPPRRRELELDRFWPQPDLDAVLGGDPARRLDSPISGEHERSAVAAGGHPVSSWAPPGNSEPEIGRGAVAAVRLA